MKKLLILVFVLGLFGGVFATYDNSYSSQWLNPEYININFHATLDNGSVHMTWAPFTVPSGHKWVYWKVIRSQTNSNPVYKVDPYIKYTSDLGFTWYTDTSPKAGTNYYRICAITQASDGYHRYCSKNVDKIDTPGYVSPEYKDTNKKEVKVCTMEYAPVCGVDGKTYGNTCMAGDTKIVYAGECKTTAMSLSETMKGKIDVLAKSFLDKIDDKYGDDANKKLARIEAVVGVIGKMKVSSTIRPFFDYLKEVLEGEIAMLQLESVLTVE